MKKYWLKIIQVAVGVWIAFCVISIIANLIPWYTQKLPLAVKHIKYRPGQQVIVTIDRTALIGMKAENFIELVHLHSGREKEVYKYKIDTYLQPGHEIIEVYYDIPPKEQCEQLETNTYKYRGIITYNPFGYLEKSFQWESETFQIEVSI